MALSADDLLKLVSVKEREQDQRRAEYCFHEHVELHVAPVKGYDLSLDYEIVNLNDGRRAKLVRRDGLSVEDGDDNEFHALDPRRGGQPIMSLLPFDARTDGPAYWLDSSCMPVRGVVREDTVEQRKVWTLESDARDGRGSFAAACGGFVRNIRIWVDEHDLVPIRRRIRAEAGAEIAVDMEYTKIADTWLLRTMTVDSTIKIAARKVKVHNVHEFSNSRKFSVDSTVGPGK